MDWLTLDGGSWAGRAWRICASLRQAVHHDDVGWQGAMEDIANTTMLSLSATTLSWIVNLRSRIATTFNCQGGGAYKN